LQRIVAKHVRVRPGTLLETVPVFVWNLIEHIDVLAFKWVLVQLFAEWSARLPDWGSVMATLITGFPEEETQGMECLSLHVRHFFGLPNAEE
jgi:hypothetical protein